MPFIPRQVKPPTRLAITCKLPEAVAALLKHYAAFLDSTQEYVIAETLQLAFRKDREFHAWLATHHPEVPIADRDLRTDTLPPWRPAAPPRTRSMTDGRTRSATAAMARPSAVESPPTAERPAREGSARP